MFVCRLKDPFIAMQDAIAYSRQRPARGAYWRWDWTPRPFFVALSRYSGQAGQSSRMYFKAKNLRIRASMHLIAF